MGRGYLLSRAGLECTVVRAVQGVEHGRWPIYCIVSTRDMADASREEKLKAARETVTR